MLQKAFRHIGKSSALNDVVLKLKVPPKLRVHKNKPQSNVSIGLLNGFAALLTE